MTAVAPETRQPAQTREMLMHEEDYLFSTLPMGESDAFLFRNILDGGKRNFFDATASCIACEPHDRLVIPSGSGATWGPALTESVTMLKWNHMQVKEDMKRQLDAKFGSETRFFNRFELNWDKQVELSAQEACHEGILRALDKVCHADKFMLTAEERRFVQQLPVSNNYAIELLNDWLKFSVARVPGSSPQITERRGYVYAQLCSKTGDDGSARRFKTPIGLLEQSGYKTHVLMSFQARAEELGDWEIAGSIERLGGGFFAKEKDPRTNEPVSASLRDIRNRATPVDHNWAKVNASKIIQSVTEGAAKVSPTKVVTATLAGSILVPTAAAAKIPDYAASMPAAVSGVSSLTTGNHITTVAIAAPALQGNLPSYLAAGMTPKVTINMVPTVVSNDILVDAEKVDTAVDPANAEIEGIVKPAAPKTRDDRIAQLAKQFGIGAAVEQSAAAEAVGSSLDTVNKPLAQKLTEVVDTYANNIEENKTKLSDAELGSGFSAIAKLKDALKDPATLTTLSADEVAIILAGTGTGYEKILATHSAAAQALLNTEALGNLKGLDENQQKILFALLATAELSGINRDAVAAEIAAAVAAGEVKGGTEAAPNSPENGGELNPELDPGTILKKEYIERVMDHMPLYKQIQDETGVPWQIMATLHIRETGGGDSARNGQGIFQHFGKNYGNGPFTFEQELEQARITANNYVLKQAKLSQYNTDNGSIATGNENLIKDIFFAYNGKAKAYFDQAERLGYDRDTQGFEGSPYVMNRADDARKSELNPAWGQILTDGGPLGKANKEPGAWLMFQALMKMTVSAPIPAPTSAPTPEQSKDGEDYSSRMQASDAFDGSEARTDSDPNFPRTPLEDKFKEKGYGNGKLPEDLLVTIGKEQQSISGGEAKLVKPAAEAFKKLDQAYYERFGEHLIINDSYRTFDEQKRTKQDAINKGRPSFAATPGHSKHGWGMAVDLGDIGEFGSERYQWLKENAIKYCFVHPAGVAQGTAQPEPWHWEYWGN